MADKQLKGIQVGGKNVPFSDVDGNVINEYYATKIALTTETNTRINSDTAIKEQISSEVGRAKAEEAKLKDLIDNISEIDLIKTKEVDNTNGDAMLRYKETENKVVLGGSTIPTTIMGSGDRPNYSSNSSDFEGKPLAFYSDIKAVFDEEIGALMEVDY